MREAAIVAQQVLLIFMYIGVGVICAKAKIVTKEGGRSLSGLALRFSSPCTIINSFIRPMSSELLRGLGLAFLLACLAYSVSCGIAHIAIRKRDDWQFRMERFAASFSNCGFMGIPLVSAVVGKIGVFYVVAMICMFQILLWSVGYRMITGQKKTNIRMILLSPGIIATATGLIIFTTQLPVPSILRELVAGVAATNTPLAMISVGVFMAGLPFNREMFGGRVLYVCFLRLLAAPLTSLLLIRLLGVHGWSAQAPVVILTVVLAAACPSPAATSNFPALIGLDGSYGATLVAVTTIFSIASLPAVAWAAQLLS